jgi:hypothetical protein
VINCGQRRAPPLAVILFAALLFVTAQETDPIISGVIAGARSFDERLPNYICKQITTRFTGAATEGPWKQEDTFEEQLTYFNRKESYKLISFKGKPTDGKRRPRRGLQAGNLFGGMLQGVFRVESKAEFEHDGEDAIGGQKVVRLRYRVRRENSRWTSAMNGKSYVRGFKGQVWADAKTLSVLRFTGQIEPEPGDPGWLGRTRIDMSYGFVKIGSEEHLLPVRSEVSLELEKKPKRNVAEFSEFRQYTTETKIEFGEPK